jgi:hypothetical protein
MIIRKGYAKHWKKAKVKIAGWGKEILERWSGRLENPSFHYSNTPVLHLSGYLFSDQIRIAQPTRNARPPIGVMAPSQRIPVKLSR